MFLSREHCSWVVGNRTLSFFPPYSSLIVYFCGVAWHSNSFHMFKRFNVSHDIQTMCQIQFILFHSYSFFVYWSSLQSDAFFVTGAEGDDDFFEQHQRHSKQQKSLKKVHIKRVQAHTHTK